MDVLMDDNTRYAQNLDLVNFIAVPSFAIVGALNDVSGYGSPEPDLREHIVWL